MKRILAFFLCVCMLFSLLATGAVAVGTDSAADDIVYIDETTAPTEAEAEETTAPVEAEPEVTVEVTAPVEETTEAADNADDAIQPQSVEMQTQVAEPVQSAAQQSEGEGEEEVVPTHPHTAENGLENHAEYTDAAWTAWDGTRATVIKDGYGISGYYYLTQDVTMPACIDVRSGQNVVICLNGYTLTGPSNARMFRVSGGSTITVCSCGNGGTLRPQANAAGAVVGMYTENGNAGGFHLKGVAVEGTSSIKQPLVQVASATTISMADCVITGNHTAGQGAGINVATINPVTLTLTNTVISGCTSTGNGGAVYANTGTTLNITGGTFSGNKAAGGGAIYMAGGTANISGAAFTGNSAGEGGAICMPRSCAGTLTLTNCSMTNNSSTTTGAGVFVGNGTVILNNVTMTGNENSGSQGSALTVGDHTSHSASVSLHDCTITGNVSTSSNKTYRAGVTVYDGDFSLTVSGKTVIDNNTIGGKNSTTERNLFLRAAGYGATDVLAKLKVGALTEGASIRITTNDTATDPDSFLSYIESGDNATPEMIQANARKIIYENREQSADETLKEICAVGYNATDRFYFEMNTDHWHADCACAIDGAMCQSHDAVAEVVGWSKWTSTNSLPTTPGRYYLENEVVLSNQQAVLAEGVYICLNGKSITKNPNAAAGGSMIMVGSGTAKGGLTVLNCEAELDEQGLLKSTAGLKGCTAKNDVQGGAITLRSGSLTLLGVEISGNAHNSDGTDGWTAGALLVRGKAEDTVNIAYSKFDNNKASAPTLGSGGAITIQLGTVNISNTVFSNNEAMKNGGAIFMPNKSGGVLYLTDCVFTGNKTTGNAEKEIAAIGGGAMFVGGGKAYLDGVTMSGNENTGNHASAITIGSSDTCSAEVTLHDCTITGNKSTSTSVAKKAAVTVLNGNYKLTISGSTVISGNTLSNGKESNLFLREATAKATVGQLTDGADIKIKTGMHNGEKAVLDPDDFLVKGVDGAWDPAWNAAWITYENNRLSVDYSDAKVFFFMEYSDHPHCLCGDRADANCDHQSLAWQPWYLEDALPETSGCYYLTQNVTLTKVHTLSEKADVKLCLNGYTVTAASGNLSYIMNDDSVLTISDCTAKTEDGVYTAGKLTGGGNGAIRLRKVEGCSGATLNLYDGIFTGNERVDFGGAISSYGNGTINLYGGMITGNKSSTHGGGIGADDNSVVNIYNGVISENESGTKGGGIWVRNSVLNIYNGTVKDNTATESGGGIHADQESEVTMSGGVVKTNSSKIGAGIMLQNYVTMELTKGYVTANAATSDGGGIYVANNCSMTMSGGTIYDNTAQGGAGVAMYKAQFTMTGGAISTNVSQAHGAGLQVKAASKAVLSGGNIQWNTSNNMGGGVYVNGKEGESVLELCGGNIRNNTAVAGAGGVLLQDDAIMNYTDGKVAFNTTEGDGGGVYVANTSTLNFSGGVIHDNEASGGAGIATHIGQINMTGGYISTNKATTRGGAMLIKASTNAELSGGYIQANTAQTWGGGICGDGRSGACEIKLSGVVIRDNESVQYGGGGLFLENSVTTELTDGTISSNVAKGDGGGMYVANNCKLTMSGGVICDNESASGAGIATYKAEIEMTGGTISTNKASVSAGGILVQETSKMTMSGGKVQFNTAQNIGGGLMVTKNTSFTLCGGTIQKNYAKKGGGGLFVTNQSTITMTSGSIAYNTTDDDAGGLYVVNQSRMTLSGGSINGNSAKSGGGVGVFKSTLNMYGGTVTGNKAKLNGGGMYVQTNSTFYLSGGSVISNTSETNGGGIYVYKETTVTMSGGTVTKNTAKSDGGGIVVNTESTFKLSDGEISQNSTTERSAGGMLIQNDSAFEMSGGEIRENASNLDGGGVYLYRRCTMEMTDGIIAENTTVGSGAGLKLNGSSATLSGGIITENVADNLGGGIHGNDESEIILTGTEITKNKAVTSGGGVYATTKSKVTLDGSEVTENECAQLGGGILIFGFTEYNMKSGKIANNTSGEKGGGLYINRGLVTIEGGEICNNTSAKGGGVYAQGDVPNYEGNVVITGGTISNNEAVEGGGIGLYRIRSQFSGGLVENNTAEVGGGIHVTNSSITDLSGIEIKNNSASGQGGGLWLARGTVTELVGTNISGNKAGAEGGGIWADGILTMDGAKITKNTSDSLGGGVYLGAMDYDGESYVSGMFKICGDLVIYDNEGKAANLYIPEGTLVNLPARGLSEGAKIGVTLQSGLLTRTIIGAYNYEGGDLEYIVTCGDRSVTDPEALPVTNDADAAQDADQAEQNSPVIYIVIAGVLLVVLIIALVLLIARKKKKNNANVES